MVNYSFDRRIEPEQLMDLLRQAGWAKHRSMEGVRRMLEGTSLTLGAWEGDRLGGFARAMTDGIYRALIDDSYSLTITRTMSTSLGCPWVITS